MKLPFLTEITENYRRQLVQEEKSPATVEKYLRDLRTFAAYLEKQGSLDLFPELLSTEKSEKSFCRIYWCPM